MKCLGGNVRVNIQMITRHLTLLLVLVWVGAVSQIFGGSICDEPTFVGAQTFSVLQETKGAAIADIDGDGLPDILATFDNFPASGFSVFRNLGSGQFAARADYPATGMSVESVFVKDLNMDGRRDVVLSSTFSEEIRVFRNTSSPGLTNFQSGVEYGLGGTQSRFVEFADFDSNGSVDIAVVSRNLASVSIYRNLSVAGSDITLAVQRVNVPSPSGQALVLSSGDMDGDGKLDLVVGGGEVRVLRNTSTSAENISFVLSSGYDTTNSALNISVGDLNGDSKPDVATANQNNSNVSILINTSAGSGNIHFTPKVDVKTGASPIGVKIADIDGDNRQDVVTSNFNGNSITVLENSTTSTSSFTVKQRRIDFGAGITPHHLTVGDVNLDGKLDVAVPDREGNTVSLLINSSIIGKPDFLSRKDFLAPDGEAGVTSIAAADFDIDGDIDVAASFDDTPTLSVFRNQDGDFADLRDLQLRFTPTVIFEPSLVADGDFDSDGKPDLVSIGTGGLRVFRNSATTPGSLSFEITPFVGDLAGAPSPGSRSSLHTVDIDTDGKIDIVASFSDIVVLYRNTSTGVGSFTFSSAGSISTQTRRPLYFGDFNMDQRLEIVHSTQTGGFRIHRNTGLAAGVFGFVAQDISVQSFFLETPAIGDIDGDQKPDIIGVDEFERLYFRNTSSGEAISFAMTGPEIVGWEPVFFGRFNDDEKPDLLTRFGNKYLTVHKNLTTGSNAPAFQAGKDIAYGGNSNGSANYSNLLSRDLDNNGLTDIITGFYGQVGTVSVILSKECSIPLYSISGLVTTPDGRGIRNATVVLTDPAGNRRIVTTSSFGLFSFENVQGGSSYTVAVQSKRYRFASRQLKVAGNVTSINFLALE